MQKTVFITGASRGIGRATAELFAAKGWRVYAGVRKQHEVRFTHHNILVVQIDVDSIGSIYRCFHQLPEIDVVVNNAGFGTFGPFEGYTEEQLESQIKTDLFGVMRVTRSAIGKLRPGGVIINLSSVAGKVGVPYYSVYSAAKFGINGFSEALSYELAEKGFRVKVIEPAPVKTDFFSKEHKQVKGYERLDRALTNWFAKSFANGDKPETIAALIYRAATDGADTLYYRPKSARGLLTLRKLVPTNLFIRKFKKRLG